MKSIGVRWGHRPAAGIAFCVTGVLGFAVQDSLIKGLSARYPVLEILGLRSALVLVVLVAVGIWIYGPGKLMTRQPGAMLIRGVFAFLAFTTYFLAMTRIPMADAAAVFMTAPLFVTLLSVPILGERVGWHRWLAVALGFLAVLIILNPGAAVFRIEAAMPLFSAVCYAMIPVLNRRIGLSEHALAMAAYATFSYLVLCLIASALVYALPASPADTGFLNNLTQRWVWPTREDLLLITLSGMIFTVALVCITQAYRISVVSVIAPFEYTYLVWASLMGFVVFGDLPGAHTVLGAACVVACGSYILYREGARGKR